MNINPDLSCFLPSLSPSRSGDVGRLIWSRRQRCPAEPTVLLAQSDGRNQESYRGTGFSLLFLSAFSLGYSINTAFFKTNPKKSLIENCSQQCSISKRVHHCSLMGILKCYYEFSSNALSHCFRRISVCKSFLLLASRKL